ncbi:hypothetical protein ASAP_1970 [Asaia bogorensis]|uniref:Uncharacterized protein n=1 Tax=Asaia bogorensis TaxID=91915 RepID=A0A060QGD1_9PROT|nr:hypothetical protein ASAP_1970 [Asaia bogorensis]
MTSRREKLNTTKSETPARHHLLMRCRGFLWAHLEHQATNAN